jgi:hypothetical protein
MELFTLTDWMALSLLMLGVMLLLALAFKMVWDLLFVCEEPDYFESIDWADVADQIRKQTLYVENNKEFECDTRDYVIHITLDWWDGKVYFGKAIFIDEDGDEHPFTDEDKEKLHQHLEYWWFN